MFPIILVHGIARFDAVVQAQKERLNLPSDSFGELHYFRNIKGHLERNGIGPVHHSDQDFAGPLALRAAQLAAIVEGITSVGSRKVHLIAHSMGGLDARFAIVNLGIAGKVASLTTIGTPHLGTTLADRVLKFGGTFLIKALKDAVDLTGFADLTTHACLRFNRSAEEFEAKNEVVYRTYSSSESAGRVFVPLLPSWLFLEIESGDNDGLVPVTSQRWGTELRAPDGTAKSVPHKAFPFPADHLNQIGWWDPGESIGHINQRPSVEERDEYEDGVKAVYLEIASSL